MGEKQDGEKKNDGEKKGDGGVNTVVLKLDMHCEGCAKKVKRSISKHFDGVESVKADCGSNKLTVVGKVDPAKIKQRVEEKIKKKVELVSPQPNKASKEGGGDKKADEKKSDEKMSDGKSDEKKSEGKSDGNKSSEKKEKPKEPQVSTVVLKTRVHCEGCAQKIRKIVGKYEGVQDVNVDLKKDTITIQGTMNMKELLPYLNVKLKRSVELAHLKKDEGAGGDKKPKEGGGGGSEKPKEGGGGGSEKPKEGGGGGSEKPKEGGGGKMGGGGEKKEGEGEKNASGGKGSVTHENTTRIEFNKMEYGGYPYGDYGYGYNYTYDPRKHGEGSYGHQVVEYWHEPGYSQPPQMFSDENPDACSVM